MPSTLDPDTLPQGRRSDQGLKGHDTRTLGPSDSSDSGSDLAGPGLIEGDLLNLDRGTNEDAEGGTLNIADAGPSIGDVDMDSDSDRYGTGEHSAAGKDSRVPANADVSVDRIVSASEAGLGTGLDQAEEALLGMTDEEIQQAAEAIEDNPAETNRKHRPRK